MVGSTNWTDVPERRPSILQVTIEKAQSRLGELIDSGIPGEEISIVEGSRIVAKLVPVVSDQLPRRPGSDAGSILYMAEDFDAPMDEFRESME